MRFAATPDAGAKDAPAAGKKPTEAELAANKEEWGLKYDDEAYKFEQEWRAISEKIENEYVLAMHNNDCL